MPGSLRFVARLRLCGDTGGVAPEPAGGSVTAALEQVMQEAAGRSAEELMEDVVEEFSYVLCPPCRAVVRGDPAGAASMRGAGPGVDQ